MRNACLTNWQDMQTTERSREVGRAIEEGEQGVSRLFMFAQSVATTISRPCIVSKPGTTDRWRREWTIIAQRHLLQRVAWSWQSILSCVWSVFHLSRRRIAPEPLPVMLDSVGWPQYSPASQHAHGVDLIGNCSSAYPWRRS